MVSLLALLSFSLFVCVTSLDATFSNDNITMLNSITRTQLLPLNPFYHCDVYPRVCLAKGGVAPDCCKKQCVSVDTDTLNCGSCGKKCKSGEACCKGKCVDVSTDRRNCGFCGMKCKYNESCCKGKCKNLSYDKRNCGGCHNKCKIWESCAFGMCNYA